LAAYNYNANIKLYNKQNTQIKFLSWMCA